MMKKELLPDETLKKKIISKGFWLYIFGFLIAPLGYIVRIILSADLPVEEVGIIYTMLGLVGILVTYNDFGITESLKYYIPKYIVEKQFNKVSSSLVYAFITQAITGIVIASLLYILSGPLSIYYFKSPSAEKIIGLFSLYFLGYNFFQVFSAFLMAVQKTFYSKLIDACRVGGMAFFVILLYFFNVGNIFNYSLARIIGLYFGVIISIVIFFLYFYKDYFAQTKIYRDKGLYRKLFSYAIIVVLSSSATLIFSQVDLQMVLLMIGPESAGYYTNYMSILGIATLILGPIFAFLFPVISELHAKADIKKIASLKDMISNNFIVLGVVFSTFFFVFAKEITLVLYGDTYLLSGIILKYSILFLFFKFLMTINFSILSGTGNVKGKFVILLSVIVLNILGNYYLISIIGIVGAALSTGLGWIVARLLSEKYIGKMYSLSIDYRYTGKNLLFVIVLGVTMYLGVLPLIKGSSRMELFIYLALIALIYISLFFVVNNDKIRSIFNEVKGLYE